MCRCYRHTKVKLLPCEEMVIKFSPRNYRKIFNETMCHYKTVKYALYRQD